MDRQYIYGFFDGEGTVLNYKRKNEVKSVEVHITQCNKEVLDAIQKELGGRIVVQRDGPENPERINGIRRKVFRWRLVGYAAVRFLKDALPFLIVKKARTLEAIQFWEERERKRIRMPNSYYLETENKRLIKMTKGERMTERAKRKQWLLDKGWD